MPRPLRVLNVAYPLTQLLPAACGGTEQVLLTLLANFARPDYRWLCMATVAAAGSCVPGTIFETNAGYWSHPARSVHCVHPAAQAAFDTAHNQAVTAALRAGGFDLVHNQGGSWYRQAAATSLPVLFTLHLPASHYPPRFLEAAPPNLWLQCVSRTQFRGFAAHPRSAGWIANGVDLEWFVPAGEPAEYLLFLGRICPEKAPHWAIEVARRLRRPVVLAGALHPFPDHIAYFRREIGPRLSGQVRWLPAPSLRQHRQLLSRCRALLIPSQAEETSSLVAMEAAACGRPVAATRRGALPEIVTDGETGILADTLDELTWAGERAALCRPNACRRRAEQHFDARRMAAEYAALYRRLVGAVRPCAA